MVTDHPLYDDGVLRISRTVHPPGLAMAGEIDESTYLPLLAALRELPDSPPEVHLDLADVSYCDLAGGGNPGRPVVLHKVPEQLRAVLEIIGWVAIPGLTVAEPG
jgi:ABC-type transporter Mla MlaB component